MLFSALVSRTELVHKAPPRSRRVPYAVRHVVLGCSEDCPLRLQPFLLLQSSGDGPERNLTQKTWGRCGACCQCIGPCFSIPDLNYSVLSPGRLAMTCGREVSRSAPTSMAAPSAGESGSCSGPPVCPTGRPLVRSAPSRLMLRLPVNSAVFPPPQAKTSTERTERANDVGAARVVCHCGARHHAAQTLQQQEDRYASEAANGAGSGEYKACGKGSLCLHSAPRRD